MDIAKNSDPNEILHEISRHISQMNNFGGRPDIVKNALKLIKKLKPKDFIRPELGVLNFEPLQAPIARARKTISQIPSSIDFLEKIPTDWRNSLNGSLHNFLTCLMRILTFDPTSGGNPSVIRSEIIDVLSRFELFFRQQNFPLMTTAFQESFSKEELITDLTRELNSKVSDFDLYKQSTQEDIEKILQKLETTQTNAQSTEEHVRKLAEESGIAAESKHFENLSNLYGKKSNWWLSSAAVSSIFLLIWAICLMKYFHLIDSTTEKLLSPDSTLFVLAVIQYSVGKLLITSVILTLIYFSVNNYKACQHNYVINRHRSEALKTYRVMVDAGKSIENRDIILMQAASCIYSVQDSGYNSRVNASSTFSVPVTLPSLISMPKSESH